MLLGLDGEYLTLTVAAAMLRIGWDFKKYAEANEGTRTGFGALLAMLGQHFGKPSVMVTLVLAIPTSVFLLKGGPAFMQVMGIVTPDGSPFHYMYALGCGAAGVALFYGAIKRIAGDP